MPEKAREIRRRINSVSSTRKITKTMEMVATSKLTRAQSRVVSAGPYLNTLKAIMSRLAGPGVDTSRYPLFEEREVKRVLLWVMTSDRGLCGAFNVNLMRKGTEVRKSHLAEGREVSLWVAGRKGVTTCRYQGVEMDRTFIGLTDRPAAADAKQLARELTAPFLAGEVDAVQIVWPEWITFGKQPPTLMQLAPIPKPEVDEGASDAEVPFLFEPSAEEIFEELLPLFIDSMVYRVLSETVAAEMVARRMAMKLATDNAEKLVRTLTLRFNRVRQSQITTEIADILGGSEALS
jgi:F-type H+-transporting ATPase subunit gamma